MHTRMQEREGGGWKATLRAGVVPAGGCKGGFSLPPRLCHCSETGTSESQASCSESALHCLVSFQKLYWRKKRGGEKRVFILV